MFLRKLLRHKHLFIGFSVGYVISAFLFPYPAFAAISVSRDPAGSSLYDQVVYTVVFDDTFDVECGDDPYPVILTHFSLMMDGGDSNVYRANEIYDDTDPAGSYTFTFDNETPILYPVNTQLFRVSDGWTSPQPNSGNSNFGFWEICLNGYDLETGSPMFEWGLDAPPPTPVPSVFIGDGPVLSIACTGSSTSSLCVPTYGTTTIPVSPSSMAFLIFIALASGGLGFYLVRQFT